jgi:hypothetical protein
MSTKRRLPPIQGTIGFVIYLSFWPSVGLLWGALGAQLIEGPTAGALDGQADVLAFGQFAAAVAAAYFSHCKPVSTIER